MIVGGRTVEGGCYGWESEESEAASPGEEVAIPRYGPAAAHGRPRFEYPVPAGIPLAHLWPWRETTQCYPELTR